MKSTTFIYCLCEPGTNTIRYFGKADDPKDRLREHLTDIKAYRHFYVQRWIRGLRKLGQKPDLHVLCEVPRDDYSRFERAFIALGRRFDMPLTNLTDGGDGVVNPAPEAIERRRQKMLGRVAWNKGKPMPVEQRKRVGDFHRGKPRPKSVEWLKNNGIARRGLKRSEADCVKMSAAHMSIKTARNTSGFVGVSLRPATGKWQSGFMLRGKSFHVGNFSKIEDAVFARNLAIANLL